MCSELLIRVGWNTNPKILDYRSQDDEPDNQVSLAAHCRGNEWRTDPGWSLILSDVPGVVHGQGWMKVRPSWDEVRQCIDQLNAVAKHIPISPLLAAIYLVTVTFQVHISNLDTSVYVNVDTPNSVQIRVIHSPTPFGTKRGTDPGLLSEL